MNRKYFTPTSGQTYQNRGGGTFICLEAFWEETAIMQNTASGWTFTAHGCGQYADGSIDWDFSTNGRFAK